MEESNIECSVFKHKKVYTCKQMGNYLSIAYGSIAKSLVMKTNEGTFILAVLPGDKRVDCEKLAKAAEVELVSLATVEEASNIAKCLVGCVYPLGNLMKIETFFDKSILAFDHIYFNPGSHTKSIKVETKDLLRLVKPVVAEFGK